MFFISGALALQSDRLDEAIGWLQTARKLDAKSAPAALRLGFALVKLGRHAEAEPHLRAALALAPRDAEACDTLGYALKALNRLPEAVVAHRRAVELDPGRANSWYNLGHALLFAGRPAEALTCHEQALAAEPGFAKAHYGRALALQSCHRISDAITAYGDALARAPQHHEARSYRLMALNYLPAITREAAFAEHVAYGAAVGESPARVPANDADSARRLRVAFLSPDLRTHSVAYFLEPLLAHLDPAQFEVVLYHDHFVVDAVSERLRARVALWRHVVGQSHEAVEAAIRADAPDILVDLSGHTGLNRLPIFARRLAPVQISYLGYPNTTGLRAMDYRFVDAITDPVGEAEPFHTEQLVRFAPTAWSYAPPVEAPEPMTASRTAGAPVTFGCFNNFAKVTDETLAVWGRLLRAVPGSRLRLKTPGLGEPAVAARVRERLTRAELFAGQVELLDRTPGAAEHLALYQGVDVALDTFPYHGTTTTCEALWMGVPVVTLIGDRHASRVGASLLTAIGRPEWIAREVDDYVRIAAELARDPARREMESRTLRDAMRASPLLDHAGQAGRFAAALRSCWSAWCARTAAAAA